jgi:hypothetical protein
MVEYSMTIPIRPLLQKSIMNQNANNSSSGISDTQSCSLERTMAMIPADAWMMAALGSIGLSLFLKLNGRKDDSRFIGDWAAPFLLLGVYTKLVRMDSTLLSQENTHRISGPR